MGIYKEVIKGLFSDALEKLVLQQLSLEVDDFAVEKSLHNQIRNLPEYFFDKKGNLDWDLFKRQIAPYTTEEFLEIIELNAKKEILNGILELAHYTSEFELKLQCKNDFADKTYSILTVSPSPYIDQAKKEGVTDKQLENFYKKYKNKARFYTKEKRAGTYWTFYQGTYNVSVSEKETKRRYDAHKNQKYLVSPAEVQVRKILIKSSGEEGAKAKARLQELHKEVIEKPETFADVAKKSIRRYSNSCKR